MNGINMQRCLIFPLEKLKEEPSTHVLMYVKNDKVSLNYRTRQSKSIYPKKFFLGDVMDMEMDNDVRP